MRLIQPGFFPEIEQRRKRDKKEDMGLLYGLLGILEQKGKA
jgi:hypothetical protein